MTAPLGQFGEQTTEMYVKEESRNSVLPRAEKEKINMEVASKTDPITKQ
jgi:hypothetical protein